MTDSVIGHWVAAFLVAKVLAASLATLVPQKRIIVVFCYLAGIPVFAALAHLNLRVAAVVALLCCGVHFRRIHILGVINHTFVEFLLLIVVFVLANEPDRLVSVIQVMLVSVWLYSVWQKLYHREFLDGTVLYWMFARLSATSPVVRLLFPDIRPIQPGIDELIPAAWRRARVMAILALLGEAVMPIVAVALSGSPLALLCLLSLAIPVGVLSGEDDFLVTNVTLSCSFLAPLEIADLWAVFQGHPVVAVILVWGVVWPLIHAVLVRRLNISTWRLFGYGMYASVPLDAFEITEEGAFRPHRGPRVNVLSGFGASRNERLRRMALRICFGRSLTLPPGVVGFSIRRRYRLATAMVSHHTLLMLGDEPQSFEVRNSAELAAFMEHVVSRSTRDITRESQ